MEKKLRLLLPALFFLALFLIAGFRFFNRLDLVVYQCDEYSYLRKSYFLDLYLTGNFKDRQWQEGDARDQTKLMEYVYGIPGKILYNKKFIDLAREESQMENKSYANYSDWAVSYGQPASSLQISQNLKKVLYAGRMISVLFTIAYLLLACLIVFWVTGFSYLLTLFTFIFLATHPIINIHGRQVLADSGLNFFLTLGLLLLLLWWKEFWQERTDVRKLLCLTILSGLVGGLAAAAKLNGLLHLIISELVFVTAAVLYFFKGKSGSKKHRLITLSWLAILNALITTGVFIGLHPNAWGNPFMEIKKFIDWRWWLTNYYRDYFPENNIASWLQAIQLIFLRTAGFMPGVGSLGFHYETKFKSLTSAWYFFPNLVLFLAGVCHLLKDTFKREGYRKMTVPILLWSLWFIILVGLYLKLDWTRYYWPLFVPFIIIDSYGILLISKLVGNIWQKHFQAISKRIGF